MIRSLFFYQSTGDIFLEKHYQGEVSRSVCDSFTKALQQGQVPEKVPCVFSGPKHYLFVVHRCSIFFVAVGEKDCPPLAVYSFIHKFIDIFEDYFSKVSAELILKNIVIVYELLEEMVDFGYPLCTENNMLKELVQPPSIVRNAVKHVVNLTNISSETTSTAHSNEFIPWRKKKVWHTSNDVYVDIIETLDCIIDRNNTPIVSEVRGEIIVKSVLSGVPDLLMSFDNWRVFQDISFHPCVRVRKWENDKVLSFIPPDGKFKLASYRYNDWEHQCPIQVQSSIHYNSKPSTSSSSSSSASSSNSNAVASIDINITRKHNHGDKHVENTALIIPLPLDVATLNLQAGPGSYTYDPIRKEIKWDIGKISFSKMASLKGSIVFQSADLDENVSKNLIVKFKMPGQVFSGARVSRLELLSEKYKPFKGIKYTSQSGLFEIRYS